MKNLLPKIDTTDGLFHNGNPATGEQGTRVTETWLNDVQDRLRDVQAEAHYVLQKAGFKPKAEIQTQLYDAIVKIIEDNRRSSGITQKGEVQLTNDYNGESEVLGLTQKAGKALKALIDSLTRSLSNYIPNSKKSSSVGSNSADTVATSAAVKTAYDKGVEANDNANRRAFGLALSDEDLNNVTAPGIYGQNANINSTAARHYPIQQAGKLMVTGSSGYGAQQLYIPFDSNYIYARGRNASNNWNDWKRIDGLDKVSKSGDTMNGTLSFQGANQNYRIGSHTWRKAIHLNGDNVIGNEAVVIAFNNNGILHLGGKPDEQFNAELDKTRLWVLGDVRTGAGKSLNATHQTTDAYVETTISNSDYGGVNFKRRGSAGNWDSRIQALPDKRWKFWVQNSHENYLPAKSGTIALLEDFTYQKIGDIEVHKYPDGTMLQTCRKRMLTGDYNKVNFNWAIAFTEMPILTATAQYLNSVGDHDTIITFVQGTSNTACHLVCGETYNNSGEIAYVNIVAIGRWK